MRMRIRRPDGTVITLVGSADELVKAAKELAPAPIKLDFPLPAAPPLQPYPWGVPLTPTAPPIGPGWGQPIITCGDTGPGKPLACFAVH